MGAMDGIMDALDAQQAELTGLLGGWTRPGGPGPPRARAGTWPTWCCTSCRRTRWPRPASATRLDAFYESMLDGADGGGQRRRRGRCHGRAAPGRAEPSCSSGGRTGAARVADRFRADDPSRRVTWVAGTLSIRTLRHHPAGRDLDPHGDVAEALGVELPPSDRLEHIARLAWRTLPYAFQRRRPHAERPGRLRPHGASRAGLVAPPRRARSTTVTGTAVDLCAVAARRVEPAATGLVAEGPDAAAVLELVRTYA